MLALRGPSWIKASGALAGCFLGLAARLVRHFSVLNTERGRAGTGQDLGLSLASGQRLIGTSKD